MPRLLLTILLALVVLTPAVAFAQSQSSACLGTPTETVNQWISLFPNGDTENQCSNNCHTWEKTCNTMASSSFRCFQTLFTSIAALDTANCNLLSPPDKGNCIMGVQSSLRSMIQNLLDDLDNARLICSDEFSDCFSDCFD